MGIKLYEIWAWDSPNDMMKDNWRQFNIKNIDLNNATKIAEVTTDSVFTLSK